MRRGKGVRNTGGEDKAVDLCPVCLGKVRNFETGFRCRLTACFAVIPHQHARARILQRSQRRHARFAKAHHGKGTRNEDYYAYGQDVLAAADGTVVAMTDGVPDNVPGSMNEFLVFGNLVILQHTDKLFSTYAHLRRGTLRVKVGDKVSEGTPILTLASLR